VTVLTVTYNIFLSVLQENFSTFSFVSLALMDTLVVLTTIYYLT